MRLEYFSLIDRILDFDLENRKIRAEGKVPTTSPVFEGHFPGYPLMPGVLLLEMMAQASGWLIIGMTGFTRMPFLAALKEAKLRSFVTPGMGLIVDAHIVHDGSGFAVASAAIKTEDKRACNSEITFRLVPFPTPHFRAVMLERATGIGFPMEAVADG
jgi:3-hydroxyacyl-[acyl-carrier-protein] dehydratase